MVIGTNPARARAALLAIASTAVLVWFGHGLNPCWPLMWIAPLPILLVAPRTSWCFAAIISGFSWFLGLLTFWHYFRAVLDMPVVACIGIFGAQALAFALAVLLFRTLLLRDAPWSALLAFPATLVSIEYLQSLISVHGTGGSLAYTQLGFLPFLQLASLTGPWGIIFFPLLFPAALAIGLHLRKSSPSKALRIVGLSLTVIWLVLIFGAIRLASPPPAGSLIRVGLVASDQSPNEGVAESGAATQQLLREYASRVASLAAQGAQVVVIPEKLGIIAGADTQDADSTLQSVADKTGATIVAGVVRIAPPLKYNEARIYSPGAPLRSYDKHHMLPPFESNLQPGTTHLLLPQPGGTWGVEICKDMDFTALSREYGQIGVGLMLVPAWDFFIDRTFHGHEAIMRGVESGFGIVRAAKGGYLTVSDNRGRILAESRSDSAPFTTLIAEVPAIHDKTLYLALGDWFAWVVLAILLISIVQLRPRR